MPKAKLYRLKTRPVEAMQFTGDNERDISSWLGTSQVLLGPESNGAVLKIWLPEFVAWIIVHPFRWIVKKPNEGAYKLDIYSDEDFKQVFEALDAPMEFPEPYSQVDQVLDALERGNHGR